MFVARLPVLIGLAALGLGSCAPWRVVPLPIPSPARSWTIVLSQSGGLAGSNMEIRVTSSGVLTAMNGRSGQQITKPLSESELQELDLLVATLSLGGHGGAPSACADCFLYELEIANSERTTRWRGDDTTLMASGAEDLIRFLGRLRDRALSGAA